MRAPTSLPVHGRRFLPVLLALAALALWFVAGALPGRAQEPPPVAAGSLLIAKVVIGEPTDATVFTARVWPCQAPTGRPATVPFAQGAPGEAVIGGDCARVAEDAQPGYRLVGWGPGDYDEKRETVTCGERPAIETSDAVEVKVPAGGTTVICAYNERVRGPVLVLAKVLLDGSAVTVSFSASVVRCGDAGTPGVPGLMEPAEPPAYLRFLGPEDPGTMDFSPGCWEVSELPQYPYRYAGWGWGKFDPEADHAACGEQPEREDQPIKLTIEEGWAGPITICFFNHPPDTGGEDPSTGGLTVAKVVLGDGAPGVEFAAEVSNDALGKATTVTFAEDAARTLAGLPAGVYRVRELPADGFVVRGWAMGWRCRQGFACPPVPGEPGDEATVAIEGNDPVVCFYNEALTKAEDPQEDDPPAPAAMTVRVVKFEHVIGFERKGAGWAFTLSGCGAAPRTEVTGSDGVAVFEGVRPAEGCVYTVREESREGWTAVTPEQFVPPTAAGGEAVLTFVNIRAWNPPCAAGCFVEPPPAPEAPAPPVTPAPPAPAQPAAPGGDGAPPEPAREGPPGAATTGSPLSPPTTSLGTPLPPNTGNGDTPGATLAAALLAAGTGLLSIATGLATVGVAGGGRRQR